MLAERLNEVAYDLRSFAKSSSLLTQLDKVVKSLRQLRQAQQSGSDATQVEQVREQLSEQLAGLYETLQKDPSNDFTPTEAKILKETDGWSVTGERLRRGLEEALEAPALEPGQVMNEVQSLRQQVQAFYESLELVIQSFDQLGVDRSTLPSGDAAEIGITYPILMGEATLSDLYQEMEEWDEHLRWFAEVGGETPGKVRVRALGSGSWEIFLETPFGLAAVIAFVVERVLKMLNHIVDLKQKWDSLRSAGSTRDITDEMIERDARDSLNERKDELVEDLLDRYPGNRGRANEIRMPLREAVDFVVEKAREGGTIEVRVIPPRDEEDDEEVSPGLGNLRDMQRRGRVMAGDRGEGLQLPRDTVELLRAAAGPDEDEEAEEDEAPAGDGDGDEAPERAGAEGPGGGAEPQPGSDGQDANGNGNEDDGEK